MCLSAARPALNLNGLRVSCHKTEPLYIQSMHEIVSSQAEFVMHIIECHYINIIYALQNRRSEFLTEKKSFLLHLIEPTIYNNDGTNLETFHES